MKPGHERVIEAMARAIDSQAFEASSWKDVATGALRAAAKEGFVLAKLPDSQRDITESLHWRMGWNACLDTTETITLEESE